MKNNSVVAKSSLVTIVANHDICMRIRDLVFSYVDAFVDATGRVVGYGVADLNELTQTNWSANHDIAIEDPSVSKSHAFFEQRDGIWHVSEVGSVNGTMGALSVSFALAEDAYAVAARAF